MGKLIASINEDCNGSVIELRLGRKEIETLYIGEQPYSTKKFQVSRIIHDVSCLCDIHTLYKIDPYDEDHRCRVVKDNELDSTDIIRRKTLIEILFKGTEKQCIRYAKKWLEDEYSIS